MKITVIWEEKSGRFVKAYVLPRKCTTLTTQVSLTFKAKMSIFRALKNGLLVTH